MSETRNLLCDTAETLFADLAAAPDFQAGWSRLTEAGFLGLLVPEAAGGFGGDWGDLFAVLRIAGQHHLALPLGEAIVASAALAASNTSVGQDIVGVADTAQGELADGRFTGVLPRAPWGRELDRVIAAVGGRVVLLSCRDGVAELAANTAGEPRDTLRFDHAPAQELACDDPRVAGAFVRVGQAAGALDAALAIAIEHVNGRRQFGRALSQFQAVQQNLAVAAVEAAAVNTAGQAAAAALDLGDGAFEMAAAKLRTNMAIGLASGILHQVHGAIGFTEEYPLQLLTRRLYAWRSEFGGDRYWADVLGRTVARAGPVGFWEEMTRRSDRS